MAAASPSATSSPLPSSAADIVWPPHLLPPYAEVELTRDAAISHYTDPSPSQSLRRLSFEEYEQTTPNLDLRLHFSDHQQKHQKTISSPKATHSTSPSDLHSSPLSPVSHPTNESFKISSLDLGIALSEGPLALQSLTLSSLLDRSALNNAGSTYISGAPHQSDIAFTLDPGGLVAQRLSLASQGRSPLFLVDQNPLLSTDPNLSHSLLSTPLLQSQPRDPLSPTSSYPLHHKQFLVQKYAAEMEGSSSGTNLLPPPPNHLVESLTLIPGPTGSYLIDPSLAGCNTGLPLEIYSLESQRNMTLFSNTRYEENEDLERLTVYSGHRSNSSSLIEAPNHVSDSTIMNSAVESSLEPKLNFDTQNVDENSNSYSNPLETPSYRQQIEDLSNHENNAEVPSVVRGHLDPNEDYSSALELLSTREQVTSPANLSLQEKVQMPTISTDENTKSSNNSPSPSSEQPAYQNSNHYITRNLENSTHYRLWCEECNQSHRGECPNQTIKLIMDKPVLTRAWASLPASYLYVSKITLNDKSFEEDSEYGIFAKKTIPKRTQFGPVEGVLAPHKDIPSNKMFKLLVMQGDEIMWLDTADETLSNWMRFVRPALHFGEMNLAVVQQGCQLYFNTTRAVNARTELRVGYSESYAAKYGLPLLKPTEEERKLLEEEENAWPCFECERRFPSSEDLQKHLNEHENDNGQDSSLAAQKVKRRRFKIFKHRSSLDQQVDRNVPARFKRIRGKPPKKIKVLPNKGSPGEEEEKQTNFLCNICHKSFPRSYSLHRHMVMHTGEKKYICPICHIKFSHVYNRNRHVRRHKSQGFMPKVRLSLPPKKKSMQIPYDWKCEKCSFSFPSSELLDIHMNIHCDSAPPSAENFSSDGDLSTPSQIDFHKCPSCEKVFSTLLLLGEHVNIHAINTSELSQENGSEIVQRKKILKCTICFKAFSTQERLVRHYLVHGNDENKPFSCNICNKRFFNNSALTCHRKVHSNETRNFKCPFCDDTFEQSSLLREHVKIHCIDGIFTCPHCFRKFSEYHNARKHIRSFHGPQVFPCDQCDKVFPRRDKLRMHLLCHSDQRDFLCASCGKQFKRKDKLKEHMHRIHHPEREARKEAHLDKVKKNKFIPKVDPTDYQRFIYKCELCLLGFKRRGMLVNHLAKRHPDVRMDSVPELNLPILKTTRNYYCQYCTKVYKSSSKRKAHIIKNHPGAALPASKKQEEDGIDGDSNEVTAPAYFHTVGSITTHPHNCQWCYKQYASKAKLIQHQMRKHPNNVAQSHLVISDSKSNPTNEDSVDDDHTPHSEDTSKEKSTTQLSTLAELLLTHRVVNSRGNSIVIDTSKNKIYIEGASSAMTLEPNANGDIASNSVEVSQTLPELTQAIYESRTSTGQFLITHMIPSSSISSSVNETLPSSLISSTPFKTTEESPEVKDAVTSPQHLPSSPGPSSLDQIHLNQILAQYPHLGFPWIPDPEEVTCLQEEQSAIDLRQDTRQQSK